MPISLIKCSYLLKTESTADSRRISLHFSYEKWISANQSSLTMNLIVLESPVDHTGSHNAHIIFRLHISISLGWYLGPTHGNMIKWAMGTEDTILSLIKGSFWEYGPFENGKRCMYPWTRKTERWQCWKVLPVVKDLIWHAFKRDIEKIAK